MSTLKTNTIQHLTSGFNNVVAHTDGAGTANAVHCRAWVNFDGTAATISPRASFNVSSITDNGTGNYTVNLVNALSDASYAVVGMTGGHGTSPSNGHRSIMMGSDMTSSSCRVIPGYTGAPTSGNDDPVVCVAFFR